MEAKNLKTKYKEVYAEVPGWLSLVRAPGS